MAIIRSGWVLQPQIITVLQPLTSQLFVIVDLLMTDVPNLVQVSVVAPIGNSDPSSLSMAQADRAFRWLRLFRSCVSVFKFSLNIKLIGTQFVVQCRIYPGVTIGLLTILLRFE